MVRTQTRIDLSMYSANHRAVLAAIIHNGANDNNYYNIREEAKPMYEAGENMWSRIASDTVEYLNIEPSGKLKRAIESGLREPSTPSYEELPSVLQDAVDDLKKMCSNTSDSGSDVKDTILKEG